MKELLWANSGKTKQVRHNSESNIYKVFLQSWTLGFKVKWWKISKFYVRENFRDNFLKIIFSFKIIFSDLVTKRQAHHCIQGWISKYVIERWHSKVPSINPTLMKSPKIFPCHSRHFIFQVNFRQDLFLLHSLFLSLSMYLLSSFPKLRNFLVSNLNNSFQFYCLLEIWTDFLLLTYYITLVQKNISKIQVCTKSWN